MQKSGIGYTGEVVIEKLLIFHKDKKVLLKTLNNRCDPEGLITELRECIHLIEDELNLPVPEEPKIKTYSSIQPPILCSLPSEDSTKNRVFVNQYSFVFNTKLARWEIKFKNPKTGNELMVGVHLAEPYNIPNNTSVKRLDFQKSDRFICFKQDVGKYDLYYGNHIVFKSVDRKLLTIC